MKLKLLNCDRCRVSDLSPLTGTCLTSLAIHNTQVSDLSPLQGMSLTTLHLEGSAVTDLSPLKEMPLENLSCDFDASRDAKILRAIKTLKTINEMPADRFWKEVDGK
jgi:Leucine-rich repeat (LRR) protein